MTPAEILKAFEDAAALLPILEETENATPAESGGTLRTVIVALEALAPIISGELIVVPAVPTEKMISRGFSFWLLCSFPDEHFVSRMYLKMIAASQEPQE